MALFVFSAILILSLVIAVMSKKGAIGSSMDDVMTASGSFGAFLIFFVSVGEIYSIGTMIGAPGAIFANGATYGTWFICYILLAYVIGYFLNPAIWRMGQLAKAVSIGDVIGWRYNSKGMQVLVALVGIGFLTPWIQNQYAGMAILFEYLNIGVSFVAAVVISSVLAFAYIAIAGIRAPAWVSVLKDILLIAAIVVVGVAAAVNMPGGVGGIFKTVAETKPEMLIVPTEPITKSVTFVMSTILFQMLGFYMLPISFQALLTSKNEHNLRKNSIYMPMYMIMFPFLVIAAYYAVAVIPDLPNKDFALLAIAVDLLPNWVIGLIAGGGALTAILVMAISALCVGGLFSKNILGVIKPNMPQKAMTNWTRIATAVFLIFGMLTALYFPALMANVITLAYGGLTQTIVAVVFGFFWKRATKWGIGAGIIAGVVSLAMIKNLMLVPWLGMNFGFWALLINLVVAVIVSLLTKPDAVAMKRFEAFKAAKPNQAK
ncbi:MAG TPA: sodium:solute symporter family protein [Anaerovoracaceae bacterium]|nr:sodium:solute symporter family protein [Anaerovoracaceae bacterium]